MQDEVIRNFVSFAEPTHPLIHALPVQFQKIWFHHYQDPQSGSQLFLAMERILEQPDQKESRFLDLLTFEIADMETLLEWQEEYNDKPFVAVDPYYIFFDGVNDNNQGIFSIGDLDQSVMEFFPELEILVKPSTNGIIIDFQDQSPETEWIKK